MNRTTTFRIFIGIAFVILMMIVIMFGLKLTDVAFNVWEHMRDAPAWLSFIWFAFFAMVSGIGGFILFKLLFKNKNKSKKEGLYADDLTEEMIAKRIEEAEESGLDTRDARREMEKLRNRRAAGKIYAALFGNISTGKSTLINALLPDVQIQTDVVGGTTDEITTYEWKSSAGDILILTDMPGLQEVGGHYDLLSRDEALRAHFVIYLIDGDLTRTQASELKALMDIGKPVVVVLNKIDLLGEAEVTLLIERLKEHIIKLGGEKANAQVVAVSAGGEREILRIMPDGKEEMVMRPIPPKIDALVDAIQDIIDGDQKALDQLRDTAVFVLAHRRVDELLVKKRQEKAEQLISSYSKKAMLGAMAAMAPGTDLIIQGYLGTQLVKELSKLYDVSVRKVDIDLLLELVQKQARKGLTITLAIAGNGLKSFPGGGTIAGGALHAVAYGMLFDSLGHAIAKALETRGKLHPIQTATLFRENMRDNMGATAKKLAKMAVSELRKAEKNDQSK